MNKEKEEQIKKAKIYYQRKWNERCNKKLKKFPLISLNDIYGKE